MTSILSTSSSVLLMLSSCAILRLLIGRKSDGGLDWTGVFFGRPRPLESTGPVCIELTNAPAHCAVDAAERSVDLGRPLLGRSSRGPSNSAGVCNPGVLPLRTE